MNELETFFQDEVEKKHFVKKTIAQIQKEQKDEARKFCEKMVEKLSFLSKYGCKVFCDKVCGQFYIDYPYSNYTRTAKVELKTEQRKYEDQQYTFFYCSEHFLVDWNYHVCHNDGKDHIGTEDIVRHIARLIG